MLAEHLHASVLRAERGAKRTVATTVVLYTAIMVWAILAVGAKNALIIMPVPLVACFVWIAIQSRRTIRRARAASTSNDAATGFLVAQRAREVNASRRLRVVAPALVGITLAMLAVSGVRANVIYWVGVAAVSASLIAAAARAHARVRALEAKR